MSYATLYQLFNALILIPWILLIVAPRWKWTKYVIYSYAFPLFFAACYAILFFATTNFAEIEFSEIHHLKAAFQNDVVILIAWTHYLVFDLFVGTWEAKDAQKNGISHWALIPCLLLTLFVGPIGFLLYMVIRWFKTKEWVIS